MSSSDKGDPGPKAVAVPGTPPPRRESGEVERIDVTAALPPRQESGEVEKLDPEALARALHVSSVASVAVRSRQVLAELLPLGETSIEHIAARLGISARTLRRRLHEEHITHAQLIDEARRELALDCLDDLNRTVYEVSALLGFAHPSAFIKAFRRWTGESPAQHLARKLRR